MAEAKRNALKKVDAALMAAGVYHAVFTDGQVFHADIRDLPVVNEAGEIVGKFGDAFAAVPPMAQRTLIYGLKQKLDDSMAGSETIADAVEEIRSTWDAILQNKWTIRVPGEGVEGGLFHRAYAEWKGIPLSDAKAKISDLVERNMEANQKAETDEEKRKAITLRRVFNSLRDAMLARYPELDAKYKELQEKRKARPKADKLVIDTTGADE